MKDPLHIWFLAFPGSEILDLAGPWSAFGYANEVLQREVYRLRLASAATQLSTRHGLVVAKAYPLRAILGQDRADTLIIAGGTPSPNLPAPEAAAARWLARNAQAVRRTASVCTGAFVLGAAGLLDGRKATTHWQYRDLLRGAFPNADVTDDHIFVQDGPIWSSAGITSGIDLSLAMIEADHGHDVAMIVAKGLVLFLRRPGGQSQFSHVLERQGREPSTATRIRTSIAERLGEELTVERVAGLNGMSVRTFSRYCATTFNQSPGRLVRQMRIEEAQRLLEQTDLPLKAIAHRSGLGSAATLWRAFGDHYGVNPASYRDRFR